MGTRLVLHTESAGCRTDEVALISRRPRSCGPGQLILANRKFLGAGLWQAFSEICSRCSTGTCTI
ncbi:hypothetical protein ACIBO9_39850 [Streptomyces prunicolor]|uniref:hypothetical protein n=1 Tax=Streptomyces prunicolor TaxID=67348 RepID=UPI0037D4D894